MHAAGGGALSIKQSSTGFFFFFNRVWKLKPHTWESPEARNPWRQSNLFIKKKSVYVRWHSGRETLQLWLVGEKVFCGLVWLFNPVFCWLSTDLTRVWVFFADRLKSHQVDSTKRHRPSSFTLWLVNSRQAQIAAGSLVSISQASFTNENRCKNPLLYFTVL